MKVDFGKHIKELLHLHDCVILPELGGFVANYRPAVFDPVRNTASPPSKHILFNRNLMHNDGLLYAHVSSVTGYGYKDVQKMALNYLKEIRETLKKGLKFEIGGLGYFFLDGEKQIQFTEDLGHNFLLEAYGLPPLHYREFDKIPAEDVYRAFRSEPDPLARQRRIRRWVYATAAACLLTALVLVPLRTGYIHLAGIDLPAGDNISKGKSTLTEQPAGGQDDNVSAAAATLENSVKAPLPWKEYNIVVGSFRDFANARMLRSQLVEKGYQARILASHEGFYRVTAGTFDQQEEASGNLTALREEFENAWILSN